MTTELQRSATMLESIEELLGEEARSLFDHKSQVIPKDQLSLPSPDFIDRVVAESKRSPWLMCSLQSLLARGGLACTAYPSILPLAQRASHPAGRLFAPDPKYFDPENIVRQTIGGLEHSSGWRGAFAFVAPLFRMNIDNDDPQSPGPFSTAEDRLCSRPDFSNRKLQRRRAEWELERDKILFFNLLVLVYTSLFGVILVVANASPITKIGAIAGLMGVVGAVLRQLARTG